MHFSDNEIIQSLKKGHTGEVLQFLYDELFPKIRRYVRQNSGDAGMAFDVFQEGIMVFYRYVMENKFDTKYEIGAFVFTVSKNIWLNRLRKERREITLAENTDFADDIDNAMENLINKEREELVTEMLAGLGKKCEELLRYSVFCRLRNSEICERMGFSTENAVKTRKYKCIQKLISYIEERPDLKKTLQEL